MCCNLLHASIAGHIHAVIQRKGNMKTASHQFKAGPAPDSSAAQTGQIKHLKKILLTCRIFFRLSGLLAA
ncbi:hypothetical protein B9T29_15570 [Acinetobacter sp. ANC 3903]|nr:hypothetical protein B9T29_15570 [Acinetobacter sp. ANC 3903]